MVDLGSGTEVPGRQWVCVPIIMANPIRCTFVLAREAKVRPSLCMAFPLWFAVLAWGRPSGYCPGRVGISTNSSGAFPTSPAAGAPLPHIFQTAWRFGWMAHFSALGGMRHLWTLAPMIHGLRSPVSLSLGICSASQLCVI